MTAYYRNFHNTSTSYYLPSINFEISLDRRPRTKPIRIPQTSISQSDRLSEVGVIIVWKNSGSRYILCGLTEIEINKEGDKEQRLSIQSGKIKTTETKEEAAVRIAWEIAGVDIEEENLMEVRRYRSKIIYYVEHESSSEPKILGQRKNPQHTYYVQSNQLSKDFERPMIITKDFSGNDTNTGLCWILIDQITEGDTDNEGYTLVPEYVSKSSYFLDIVYLNYEFFY